MFRSFFLFPSNTAIILVQEIPLKLEVSVEPNFISLGPFHIAVGMNDRVWIHEIGEQGACV